jgi:hypothetical protein
MTITSIFSYQERWRDWPCEASATGAICVMQTTVVLIPAERCEGVLADKRGISFPFAQSASSCSPQEGAFYFSLLFFNEKGG